LVLNNKKGAIIVKFCDMVEDFCGRAEILDEADGAEWLSIPLNDEERGWGRSRGR